MKLYDSIGPNPRIVRMFMAEKGIEMPKQKVDLRGGENRKPEHLQRNPHGQLPTLELDDGSFLSEITAICEYLEEKQPEPAMIGATPEQRAECRMWTRRVDLNICKPLANGYRFGEGLKFFQIDRLVEFPLRGGWNIAQPKAKRAGPIIGRLQKVIQLAELGFARLFLDNAAAPVIRAGIAQCAEDAIQLSGLVSPRGEFQFDGIDLDRLRILQVRAAVDEAPERITPWFFRQHKLARRYPRQLPR